MKRRNLCKAKKLMTVVVSASMVMGSVVPAMAGVDGVVGVMVTATDGGTESVEKSEAKAENNVGSATGVYGNAYYDSTATAVIDNDVSAISTSDNSYATATGVNANSYDNSNTNVSVGGDVEATVTSEGGYKATGIDAMSSYESNTNVSVTGNVTVSDSDSQWGATGVEAHSEYSSKTEVDIGKDLTVSGGTDVTGIEATSGTYADYDNNSTVLVTVGGDVTVTGNQGSSDYASATGVEATAKGNSKTEVDIHGNLKVSSKGESTNSTAISAEARSDDSSVGVTVDGDVIANGYKTISAGGLGDVDIKIGGKVVNADEQGSALDLSDGYNNDSTATLTVSVAKNITAAGDAVTITKVSDKSSIDILVEGTITGEHAIVLDEKFTGSDETSSTEKLNITVWKIETTGDSGSIVEDAKHIYEESKVKTEYTQNEEAEKNINYILQVVPIATSIGGALSFSGTTDIHGFQTAHAGDTVFLELTIPSDYTVDSFYNVDGAANVNVISSGGKYYLEVPRGGGVFVGVNLKRVSGSGSSDSDSSGSSDDKWTVTNAQKGKTGVFYPAAFEGLTFQVTGADGTPIVLNVLDVLTPLEPISAFNNFTLGAPTYDLNNVLGAAIVDFNDLLATTAGDTVNVPVAANVTNGKYYIVYFSDGTSTTVQCTADGFLTIPFGKNTKGLTYMIYEAQTDSLMGLTPIQDIREIQEFQYQSDNSLKQIGSDSFASAEGLWTPFLDQAESGVLNLSLENSNER